MPVLNALPMREQPRVVNWLSEYKYGTEAVCSCAVIYDGWWEGHYDESCHGFTQDLERDCLLGVATATCCGDDRFHDLATEYFTWMVAGEDSPWRNTRGELIYKDHDLVGLYIPANQSYQLAMNAMVAIRTPWERPNKLRAWKRFQDNGFTRVEALYLCSHFWWGGLSWKKAIDHPHTPIEPYQMPSLKKLTNATPTLWPDNDFDQNGSEYTPLTYIWDKDDDLSNACRYMYDGVNHPLYRLTAKTIPYTGLFPEHFKNNDNRALVFEQQGVPEDAELMEMLHNNREAWDDRYQTVLNLQEGQAA